jgi:CRP/FNR family transcriptional regulator, cyclic AMP receptor protein
MTGFDWLDTLDPAVKEELLSLAKDKSYPQGAMIQEGGQIATHVHQIVAGRVRQFILDENGNEILVHVYEAGDVLGDSLGLGDLSYPLWLSTASEVSLRSWPAAVFARLRSTHASIDAALAQQTARRFRIAIALLLELATLDAYGRVAGRLVHLAEFARNRGVLSLTCSQEDLAMMANVSRQTVNRTIAKLTADGIVHGGYGNIRVHDLEALKSYRNSRRRRP